MKFRIILSCLLIAVGCSSHKVTEKKLVPLITPPEIVFTVTEGIAHPESALYSHELKTIFVSNVASGNPLETKRVGYISQLSPDGKVIKTKWVSGLKAPKGMAIVGNYLYVSDVNQFVKIDIKKARIVKTVSIRGSKFLNDVVADKNGNVYVSDMFTDTIHVWNKAGVRPWLKSPSLRGPNGLYTDGQEHILFVSWGNPIDMKTFQTQNPGSLAAISLKKPSSDISEENSIKGNLDGISADAVGNLWISDWMNGDIYVTKKNGSAEKKYNFGQGTADISVAKELNLLLIPQMNESKVIAVKIQ